MNQAAAQTPVLSRRLLFLFALPGILQAFMHAPAGSILQGVYAKESGIDLLDLGSAVMVVRVFDIFSDLLIGYLSDYTASRGISRKLWIGAGTLVTVLGLWFLLRPPAEVSVMYYGFWFLAANVGWSLIEIPYRSWNLEFSPEPEQRARVVTWIAAFSLLGAMLFYIIAPLGQKLGLLETGEVNFQLLGLTAMVVALLCPLLNLLTLLRVPDTRVPVAPAPREQLPRESFALIWASVIGNKPMIYLIACFATCNFMQGLSQGVALLYLTNYLGLSSSANTVLGFALLIGLLGIPFWGWMSTKYSRQRVWAVAMALSGAFYASFSLLPPHTSVAPLVLLYGGMAFCVLSTVVAAPVIMGDIIDYGKEKFGVDRAGLYMSFQGQVLKGVNAVAGGAGLMLLGWVGFDAKASAAELTPQAVMMLKAIMSWLPGFGMLSTAIGIWFFPSNAKLRAATVSPNS